MAAAGTSSNDKMVKKKYSSSSSDVDVDDERAGAEIVYGREECYRQSVELLEELGFPKGVLPLKELEECGRVRETGFVWMKQKAPYEHFFEGSNSRVSYSREVTAYIEQSKMKKMTGVKSKQLMLWVPIVEMTINNNTNNDDDDDENPIPITKKKIYFKTPLGIGKSFPATAFMTDDDDDQKKN